MDLIKLVNERIESNKHLFTDYELNIIKENQLLIKKIYLMAMADVTNTILKS